MDCQFCNKNFSDKYKLIRHQQTAKKCLKIQEENNNPNIKIKKFDCKFCKKKLSSPHSLKNHLNICKSKLVTKTNIIEDIIDIKDNKSVDNIDIDTIGDIETTKELFKQLQNELRKTKEDLKNKTGVVNNYIINNNTINNNITINMNFLDFMSGENIKQIFDNEYNGQIFLGAEKSLAEFLVEKFLIGKDKPSYFCPDKSRYNFTYFNNDELMDDLNARMLIRLSKMYGREAIFNAYMTHKQNGENIPDIDVIYNKLKNIDHNNKEILNELRILLPKNLKDLEIQNKIHDLKIENDKKIKEKEIEEDKKTKKKDKIKKQLFENIDLNDYESKIKKEQIEGFINHYLTTQELKCPKIFTQKDQTTFKNYVIKWSKKIYD